MKKRGFAVLLALCMALALVPTAAFAADADGFEIENGKLTRYTGPGGVVNIPDGVTAIEGYPWGAVGYSGAFQDNTGVALVNFPYSLTKIGNYAFKNCSSLAKVTFTNGIATVGSEAFYRCGSLTSITIPENISSLGESVFYGCERLSNVTVAEGTESLAIPNSAFANCGVLTSVSLSERVTALGANCFQNCGCLQSITLPKSVQVISEEAFKDCGALTSVTIHNTGIIISKNAFNGTNLRDVYYGGTEAQWNAVMVDKEGNDNLLNATIHCNTAAPDNTPDPTPGTDPNPGTNPGTNPTPGADPSNVHFTRANVYHQGQFTDVPANQWYTQSVADAFELGLMKGNSDTTFGVNGNVTVAEAITMACRIHAIYTTGSDSAITTAQTGGQWYQPYLDYARQNKIISDAYYNSDVTQNATRAQFAEVFANSLPAEALSSINSIADGRIPDVPMTANYASAVYKLYRAGILAGGDATGTFSPSSFISRVEAAAITARMAESNSRVSFSL